MYESDQCGSSSRHKTVGGVPVYDELTRNGPPYDSRASFKIVRIPFPSALSASSCISTVKRTLLRDTLDRKVTSNDMDLGSRSPYFRFLQTQCIFNPLFLH